MNNEKLLKEAIDKGLRVLFWDIETSPMEVWTYAIGQNIAISPSQIEHESKITSIAYMFEGDKFPKYLEWEFKDGEGDDELMLKKFVSVLDTADIVVAQNGDRFDLTTFYWRLNELKLPPPENEIITLDTLKLSRRVFRSPSHKLDYRSKVYGFGGKIKQDMGDCIAVAKGDSKKQKERVRYNIKDVLDLRRLFWREINYYFIPKQIAKLLKNYIYEKRPFCKKCEVKRRKKYDVSSVEKTDMHIQYKCRNCDYKWKVRKKHA